MAENEKDIHTTEPEAQTAEPSPEETAEETTPDLAAQLAQLTEQLKEKDDRYLRMAAEYDNFRRRSREEKEAVYDHAVFDTVQGLLPIFDNLERAAQYGDGEKVKEGLAMLLKSTEEVLTKIGITTFGEVGETFDPQIHNAVFHVEDDTLGEGVITEVFQKGYKKGQKILRFAMVKTAN